MFIRSRKGQIFPLLIAIASILIIAALISANLGKVSLDRLGCINGADAGATAGISDFTCGYNKASTQHKRIKIIYWVTFAFLMRWWPCTKYPDCWTGDHLVAYTPASLINNILFEMAKSDVEGFSSGVRQDAYYYAFINANIDDPYKKDGRRYPALGEDWQHWISLKSAFDAWWNSFPKGWEIAGSLTYNWHDGSKWVRVSCGSSPYEELEAKNTLTGGLYSIPVPSLCYIPIWIPHGMLKRGMEEPSLRFVNINVERGSSETEKSLGFWRAFRPNTRASASAVMRGTMADGYDYDLR